MTFDKKQPFANEGIAHILRLEIFAAKGGANIEVFRDIVGARRIRGPTVALMLTVVCNVSFVSYFLLTVLLDRACIDGVFGRQL